MKKILILLVATIFFNVAFAESTPRGLSTDCRVKIVTYDPNNVVALRGHFGFQTQIVFAPNETVQNVSIGDSMAWQAVPVANNLFLKPTAESKTNMTVLTNVNSYNFQLDSHDSGIKPTYKLQFIYPDGGFDAFGAPNAVATFDPEKLNWKYSYTGDNTLVPMEIFDNGQFTYMKFRKDGMSRLPAIFIVDKDRNETLINYHVQGDFVVVNSTAKQFTLRDGGYVTCVYNDYAIGDWQQVRG